MSSHFSRRAYALYLALTLLVVGLLSTGCNPQDVTPATASARPTQTPPPPRTAPTHIPIVVKPIMLGLGMHGISYKFSIDETVEVKRILRSYRLINGSSVTLSVSPPPDVVRLKAGSTDDPVEITSPAPPPGKKNYKVTTELNAMDAPVSSKILVTVVAVKVSPDAAVADEYTIGPVICKVQ